MVESTPAQDARAHTHTHTHNCNAPDTSDGGWLGVFSSCLVSLRVACDVRKTNELEGVFVATAPPAMDIDPQAWATTAARGKGPGRGPAGGQSPFPAQVRVCKVMNLLPVSIPRSTLCPPPLFPYVSASVPSGCLTPSLLLLRHFLRAFSMSPSARL